MAEYLETVASRPVASTVTPGDIVARLPEVSPSEGEPIERILESVSRDLLPGITHWNHPRFFAYVPQSAPPPAIVADMIISALNVNGLLWSTSPALTELEQVVLRWLAELLGLPAHWFGQIQESASQATLTALTVARERARRDGGRGHRRVVCSSATHASVHKAAHLLDLPLTEVPTDPEGRMSLPQLERVLADREVCAVVATVGTTSSAAVDPLPEIGALCGASGAWLHVDGAYAAAAAICPEHASLLDGLDAADSFVINAHKWLGVTAGCACLYTPHRAELRATFETSPDYLLKDPSQINLVDYGPMFSHRFAALKLFVALRASGSERLREQIREAVELAYELGQMIAEDPAWELCSQRLGVVCFSLSESPELNPRLLQEINRDGRIFVSGTRLGDRPVLRIAIGNKMTRREDVVLAWDVLRELRWRLQGQVDGLGTERLV